jgi:pimeloyl-ACP methyl ester carboxylesterase
MLRHFTSVYTITAVFIILSTEGGCKNKNMATEAQKTERKPIAGKDQKPVSGYAPVNGINMYYEIHGQGKPLVLIHGGGSTIQTSFGYILPLLAEHYQVIALELQAHGHTSDRDSPESFEQDADDVAALLSFLNINKADLLGFSNGGNTAMQVSIRHPQLVRKLVIASAFYKRDGLIKGFFEGMAQAKPGDMPAYLQKAFLRINNDTNRLQNMFEKDRNRMLQFKDWRDEDLAAIKVPALLIFGDHDVATREHGVEMSRKIPRAELLILPGNHGSYMAEAATEVTDDAVPALTVAVISAFLNRQEP